MNYDTKRAFFRFLIGVIIPIAIWVIPVGIIAQETTNPEEIDPREELEEINDQRAALGRQLDEFRRAENLALDDLEEIDRELSYISNRIDTTTSTLERKTAQVKLLNQTNAQAVADLNSAQSRFEARLVEWYKSGVGSLVGSLVITGDLSDFIYVISYMEAIMEKDQKTIDFIREQQGIIFEQTRRLQQEIAECETLIAEMHENEARYDSLRQARFSAVSQISNNVDVVEQSMRELEAASYEFTMMLQASTYAGGSSGGLIRPVNAQINSEFGYRQHPIFGGTRMHTGVDMACPYGTLIHAAQSGYVEFSGWKRGYGNTIIINHGNGLATLYGHCSSLLVGQGETVSRGQVIAKVGSTGYSTGNHLHFEVRVNGEPVDPQNYI